MAAAAPPATDAELEAKKGELKGTETKESAPGGSVDPTVLATYKAAWADNGGDKDKICSALALDPAKWVDDMTEEKFLGKFLGTK